MAQKYMGKNPANPNCIGENVSPPLQWRNAAAATRVGTGWASSIGLFMASALLPLHYRKAALQRRRARTNVFTIVATDLEPNALKPGLTMPQMLDAIGSHALVAAGLVGRYGW